MKKMPDKKIDSAPISIGDAKILISDHGYPAHMPSKTGRRFARILHRYITEAVRKPRTVLDLGCGGGVLSLIAASNGCSVTGTDISEANIAAARKNIACNSMEAEFLFGNGLAPVKGRQFDLVVCNPPSIGSPDSKQADTLIGELRANMASADRIAHSALVYITSNVAPNLEEKLARWRADKHELLSVVMVALNRPEFWPIYASEDLAQWTKRGAAFSRNDITLLKGRFVAFHYNAD